MTNFMVMALVGWASTSPPAPDGSSLVLDFGADVVVTPVNDSVMGGVSRSGFDTESGVGVFSGTLSLDNGGGFASIRFLNPQPDLSGFQALSLSFKGDGRSYQLRLRDDRRLDGVAWQSLFSTEAGVWQQITVPLDAFAPTFRGRRVEGAGPLQTDRIHQITLMLADKQPGEFRLEIGKLVALRQP